ncbi:MAG: MFS transporter [Candidatus Heimdallarchaeota archaeon]
MSELKKLIKRGAQLPPKVEHLPSNYSNLGQWKFNIWKSYLFHLFMGFHFISGVLLPFFMTWGKLNFIEVMFLQSFFTMMILLLEIPCGAVADYLSRKLSLTLGAISTALAALIYGIYPHIVIFTIGETLWAFGAALTSGSDQAFLYDTLKKLNQENKISKIMAKNRSFMLLGIGISAPLGSIIAASLSLNLVMTMMVIPFFIATMISLTLKEPTQEKLKKRSTSYLKIIKDGLKQLKNNKILRLLAVEMIITESMVFFLIWTYQIYLEALNVQILFYGFISAMMTIIQIIFNNLVSSIENKINNKRRLLQLFTIIPGVGFISMALIFFIPISVPLIILIVGFGFSRSIIFVKGINKQIETGSRATVLSAINMIASLLRTLLYPVVGYLITWNLSLSLILLGSVIIIATIVSRIKSEYL